ncbi:unnamed protein product [Rhodiola kirilowii]
MDKTWMNLSDKCDPRFAQGITNFVNFVKQKKPRRTTHKCPCRRCRLHHAKLSLDEIQTHLFRNGIMQDYTTWTSHGEVENDASSSIYTQRQQYVMEKSCGTVEESGAYYMDPTIEMLNDAFPFPEPQDDIETEYLGKEAYDKYQRLLAEAHTPIYVGSDKTVLGTILSAMKVKVDNGWSDKSFNDHLRITQDLLPSPNNYPGSYSEVKRLLKNLGMGYEIIHACAFGCALFYKDFKNHEHCPMCNESRYLDGDVDRRIPRKVVRHFPLTPRLQRLYMSPHIAKEMRWHRERKVKNGHIRHPADGEAWKEFDNKYPDFARDARNVRLGLATDGFNPFGAAGLSHSTWPIVVMPYNLPPSMCMKKEFNILALLISGPKSPGKCLNVFMQPLIDELNVLWDTGVLTFDRHDRSTFNMKAAVMWTISDFPGLGMLGGLKCKGYKACPSCLDDIDAKYLAERMSYQGHRRWLDRDHSWRHQSSKFNGEVELRDAPPTLTGEEVFSSVLSHDYPAISLHPDFKSSGVNKEKLCWTHMSIFYDLPYWSTLRQPYSLDVMHIEKNVFDNIIGTILGLQGKTKDDVKAREGLELLGIRKELWLKRIGSSSRKDKVSQAPYTILPEHRAEIFEFIQDAKYPYGYAGSLKNKINVEEKKFNGLKTHDCHVMLQRLLPVFIRPYLPHYVIEPLISLSRWFQKLCCKEFTVSDAIQMKDDIVIILCKLETVFPPAFFTIMVHLLIHLPDQVLLKGPVHYSWMYPIERQLGEYKRSVRNTRYPEGCIAEQYITHECVLYCKLYMTDATEMDSSNEVRLYVLNVYSPLITVSGHCPRIKLSKKQIDMMHWCVVEHCVQAKPFIKRHGKKFDIECPNRSKKERVKHFITYFRGWMDILERERSESYSTEVHSLSRMPQSYACHSQCNVNGVKFVVWECDRKKRTQNSGVMVEDGELTYYGIIRNIIQLQYANGMPVFVFDCTWFNTDPKDSGSTKRDYGLLSVDTSTTWYEDWPYCLATTARQVFYLDDLKAGDNWKVVNVVSHRGLYSDSSLAREDENVLCATHLPVEDDDPYQEQMPTNITSDVHPSTQYSIEDHINQHIPRARRQLYLDEDDETGDEEDDETRDEKDDEKGDKDDEEAGDEDDDEVGDEEDDDDDVGDEADDDDDVGDEDDDEVGDGYQDESGDDEDDEVGEGEMNRSDDSMQSNYATDDDC